MTVQPLPRRVLYYGQDMPLPEPVPLRAGPLTLLFEEGSLRSIRLGEREVLRGVYVAVRDRNWDTVLPRLSNVHVEQDADSFRITFDCRHQAGAVDFVWQATIVGDGQGTITFTMDGEARSTFLRNRIGFCVLHPIKECAGFPYRVLTADGSTERGAFPSAISPHQPVKEIQAIAHAVLPDLWAEVRFTGDIFEMEDQRNWTDASYKTYCTPLRLPFPVAVPQGTRIAQSVTLALQGEAPRRPPATGADLTFTLEPAAAAGSLPPIGLGVASHGQPLTERELTRLRALNLAHLRLDLTLARPDVPAALRQAAAEARALGVPLEIAVFLSDAAADELAALRGALAEIKPPVARWLIFHTAEPSTSERWVTLARRVLAEAEPGAAIGAGTNAYFTELNRGRPPVAALDLVCYSITPQVHAFDNATLVENLEAQAWTVDSARHFIGDRPLAITPITLKPRFNPNATSAAADDEPGRLPEPVDVRQMSLFGAGWTVGSLKYLAESGVASLTYYETTGWRGVMERAAGSPQPDLFRSLPGAVFPLYHVLADVGEYAGGSVIPSRSSNPLQLDGLALRQDGHTRVIIANLSPEQRRVRVQNLDGLVQARFLDETNAVQAMIAPEAFRATPAESLPVVDRQLTLDLLPYAIVRLDTAGGAH